MIQNILIDEYLSVEALKAIMEIINDYEDMDNGSRADRVISLLRPYGFFELGCGTNRICLCNYDDDNYELDKVFKIALDDRGIADNNVEYALSKSLQPYVTQTYENIGSVAVQERAKRTMKLEDWDYFRDDCEYILQKISKKYVLNDIGEKSFKNWGIRYDGSPVVLDYAYLKKVNGVDFACKKCGGQLTYTEDLSKFVCLDCDAVYLIGEVVQEIADPVIAAGFEIIEDCSRYDLNNDCDVSDLEIRGFEIIE